MLNIRNFCYIYALFAFLLHYPFIGAYFLIIGGVVGYIVATPEKDK